MGVRTRWGERGWWMKMKESLSNIYVILVPFMPFLSYNKCACTCYSLLFSLFLCLLRRILIFFFILLTFSPPSLSLCLSFYVELLHEIWMWGFYSLDKWKKLIFEAFLEVFYSVFYSSKLPLLKNFKMYQSYHWFLMK